MRRRTTSRHPKYSAPLTKGPKVKMFKPMKPMHFPIKVPKPKGVR